MVNELVTFFRLPDRFDESQKRAANVLNVMLLVQGIAVLTILLLALGTGFTSLGDPAITAIIIDLFVYLCAKLLLNAGQLRRAGILMIMMQGLNLTMAIWLQAGVRDMKVAAFLGLIAMAGLILGRKDTIFVGLFTMLIVSLLYLAELTGVQVRSTPDMVQDGDIAVLLSVLIVIGILMYVASNSINNDLLSYTTSEQQIQSGNKRLSAEIVKQRSAEQELRATNQYLAETQKGLEANVRRRTRDLARINRDRELLLQVTSQDLKQPLHIIRAQSRQALQQLDPLTDSVASSYLERVVRAADRMDNLLNDVVKLAEVQQLDSAPSITDLDETVAIVLERLEAQIEASQAQIIVSEDLPKLYVDTLWASEAIYNLVSNALKYCQPDAPPDIEIQRHEDDSGLGVAILDRGPGVAAEYRERIFELFKRTVNREVAGTGAGLAIVRQIANRHGGRTWVEPRQGGGSIFYLTFGQAARVTKS